MRTKISKSAHLVLKSRTNLLGKLLKSLRDLNIEVISPVRPDASCQAHTEERYDAFLFTIGWDTHRLSVFVNRQIRIGPSHGCIWEPSRQREILAHRLLRVLSTFTLHTISKSTTSCHLAHTGGSRSCNASVSSRPLWRGKISSNGEQELMHSCQLSSSPSSSERISASASSAAWRTI